MFIYIYVCELYSCCVCAVHDMVISQANGWHPDLGLPTKAGCFDVMVTSSFSSVFGPLLVKLDDAKIWQLYISW